MTCGQTRREHVQRLKEAPRGKRRKPGLLESTFGSTSVGRYQKRISMLQETGTEWLSQEVKTGVSRRPTRRRPRREPLHMNPEGPLPLFADHHHRRRV